MILKTDPDKIEVHWFDSKEGCKAMAEHMKMMSNEWGKILYQGKLSDVTEEQASEWVEVKYWQDRTPNGMVNMRYTVRYDEELAIGFKPLDSLKSAVSKEWIIITKTKVK